MLLSHIRKFLAPFNPEHLQHSHFASLFEWLVVFSKMIFKVRLILAYDREFILSFTTFLETIDVEIHIACFCGESHF